MELENNLKNRVSDESQSHSAINAVVFNCVRYKVLVHETLRITSVFIVHFPIKP